MYRAKAGGRDRVEAFTEETRRASIAALQTSSELRRGLERGEVVPYFQPIVDLDGGQVVGLRGVGAVAASRPWSARAGPVPPDGGRGRSDGRPRRSNPARLVGATRPLASRRPAVRRLLLVRQRRDTTVDRRQLPRSGARCTRRDRDRRRFAVVGDHRDGPDGRHQGGRQRLARPARARAAPRRSTTSAPGTRRSPTSSDSRSRPSRSTGRS